MSNVVYVPSLCKDQVIDKNGEPETIQAKFKGEVVLRRPFFEEREEYKKHIYQLTFGEDGKPKITKDSVGVMVDLVKATKSHYVKVDIEKVSDGSKYKSFDDLSLDPACDSALYEIAIQVAMGFPMGKN